MIVNIWLSYFLVTSTTCVIGVIMTLADIKEPKALSFALGLMIVVFPFLLVGTGLHWIWSE